MYSKDCNIILGFHWYRFFEYVYFVCCLKLYQKSTRKIIFDTTLIGYVKELECLQKQNKKRRKNRMGIIRYKNINRKNFDELLYQTEYYYKNKIWIHNSSFPI